MPNNSRYQGMMWLPAKDSLGLGSLRFKTECAPMHHTMGIRSKSWTLRGWEGTRLQCWILIELENIGCCFERWAFEIRKGVILESSGTLKLWSTPLFKFSYQDIGFAACIEVHSRDVWSCTELSTLTDFWCLCTSRLLDSRYFLTCSCLYMA